jgi:PAS domain S-box-containing protein
MIFVISVIVLVGWAFDLRGLESFVPQSAGTKVNSAVALILAAIGLLRRDHRDLPIYSILVSLIGALTLGEYLSNSDFGIDQLIVRDTHYFAFPGRMSQYTSVGFVFLGLSLLSMRSQRVTLRELSRALAAATGTLGLIVLVSHILATPALNLVGPHRNVAVPTAIGFTIAAIGVQYANPLEGLVRLLHADNPGGVTLRRLLPAALLATLVLALVVTHADRQFRWEAGFSLTLVGAVVAACLVTVIVLTATALERENRARQESEQRFLVAANSAPVKIWMSGTDKLRIYFNQRWLQFRGRTLQEELGNGWVEGVHPDDLRECMSTYVDSFDRRERFQMEYRLRRHDGEYRWVFDTGVPRFLDGTFAGYIGSCIDVTDHKLAEEALVHLERKVINAQEEERSRIARELHDDINQRVALVIWELSSLDETKAASKSNVRGAVDSAVNQLRKVANDIQAISRRLHASHLEYLGLATAAGVLCKEMAAQQQIEIHLECDPQFPRLPKNISLSLYRVLQEALQNAIKHSGARRIDVHLAESANEARLSVSDRGLGFDPERSDKKQGLGLISMRERIRLVQGEFVIDSEPGRGTTIRCRVAIGTGSPTEQLEQRSRNM